MNRRRWLTTACFLTLSIGCHREPDFGSPENEYRYLRGLSNPTPEQYLRREELGRQESEDKRLMLEEPEPGDRWTVRDAVEAKDRGDAAAESLPR
jgi:hypothetical protein